jgi:hypothetical protein
MLCNERLAEIDQELADSASREPNYLPQYAEIGPRIAERHRADLEAERAAIVADPEAWERKQKAWEAHVEACDVFSLLR